MRNRFGDSVPLLASAGRYVFPAIRPLSPLHLIDLDGSGDVGITDFLDLLAQWGPC